jgi:uncharacterized protein
MYHKGGLMKCPACKEAVLTMSERQGIEIDYCPQCRGVWLDRGELDKIIEKSLSEQQTSSPPPPKQNNQNHNQPIQNNNWPRQPDPYQKDYYKYKRKKSFLEELFD